MGHKTQDRVDRLIDGWWVQLYALDRAQVRVPSIDPNTFAEWLASYPYNALPPLMRAGPLPLLH